MTSSTTPRTRTSTLDDGDGDQRRRWAWQSLPVLQLPPVEVGAIDSSSNNSNGKLLRSRPRSLLARVENRILQVKEHNQVESVLKTAEQALHLRRK
ncbi:unnamed protein product [Ectocarpus sp. 12 AP-2014]